MKNALALPLLLLAACLENEEVITVHPDGSLTVRVAAEGNAEDLAEGHPLPVGQEWRAIGAATESWLANVGPLSGGRVARERVRAGAWRDANGEPFEKQRLEVEGRFASAHELPTRFAPDAEPRANATLERRTSLDVQTKGERTVYVFERVYAAPCGLSSFVEGLAELDARVPKALMERLELEVKGQGAASADDWAELVWQTRELVIQNARPIVDATFLALYTQGDASLSLAARERSKAAMLEHVGGAVTVELWRRFSSEMAEWELAEQAGSLPAGPYPTETFEAELRAALRAGLETALAAEDVDAGVRAAALEALAWQLAALDQTSDVADEEFELDVHMPGTIVGGNYTGARGGHAHFEFEGKLLREREVRLRVVSVLE